MSDRKINVLIAEDSTVIRMFLVHLLESDPLIHVIGSVADGQAALDFVKETKPDVILMDIHMPRMDGFEATRRIMESNPVPIVICSATANIKDVVISFQAMEAGAIACIEKPLGLEHTNFEIIANHMLETVKLMSEVKVVHRSARLHAPPTKEQPEWRNGGAEIKIVGIGASTGGPPVLQALLAALPKDFPVPILVVQHIAQGFIAGMAEWLNRTTGLQIHVASYGTCPLPSHVYLAPDDLHMGVNKSGGLVLTREDPMNHLRPSVSFLFRSLALIHGPSALGVLLTGMGKDGAAELKLMKDHGAITIAQDKKSSVVYGMPGAAVALGGATHILAGDKIADALVTLVKKKPY